MTEILRKIIRYSLLFSGALCALSARAQTESDALMIPRHYICTDLSFMHTAWSSYWEGTFKRTNQNLGTVSSNTYSLMENYGITNNLNLLVSVPYITTRAAAGTLAPHQGLQDLMVSLKLVAFKVRFKNSQFRLLTTLTGSLPLSNYEADFQPLSIGFHSKSLMGRVMADYQYAHFFITGSAAYVYRDNIFIDRNSYYTTTEHYTNEVFMPDQLLLAVRTGLRTHTLIAEAVVGQMNTLGGFDIRKNDMPFPGNRMNQVTAGLNLKYSSTYIPGLEASAGADYVVAGRNVGQGTMLHVGINYLADLSRKH